MEGGRKCMVCKGTGQVADRDFQKPEDPQNRVENLTDNVDDELHRKPED